MKFLLLLGSSALQLQTALCGKPGLARTPPMGWSSWYAFYYDIDENITMSTAHAMVDSGLRDVGYEYMLTVAWNAPNRDRYGNLVPCPEMASLGEIWKISRCAAA